MPVDHLDHGKLFDVSFLMLGRFFVAPITISPLILLFEHI